MWNSLIIHKSYDQSISSILSHMHHCKLKDRWMINQLLSISMGIYSGSPLVHYCKRQYRFPTHVLSATEWFVHIGGKWWIKGLVESGHLACNAKKTSRISKLIYLQNHIRLKLGVNVCIWGNLTVTEIHSSLVKEMVWYKDLSACFDREPDSKYFVSCKITQLHAQ